MGAKVSDWRPYNNRVQGGLRDGNFINGQFVLLCAGPPYLSMATGGAGGEALTAYPIGLTQNFALSQNKAVSRIFEIGSERSYFIPGRSVGQLTLGRVVYHGPSLLRMLYASFGSATQAGYQNISPLTEASVTVNPLSTNAALNNENTIQNAQIGAKPLVSIPPGYDNMFLNLASDMFNRPIGLLFIMKDSEQNNVASMYFENCYIPSHSLAVDSQGLIMQESVGIQYERIMPIKISKGVVPLVKPNNPDEFGATYQVAGV